MTWGNFKRQMNVLWQDKRPGRMMFHSHARMRPRTYRRIVISLECLSLASVAARVVFGQSPARWMAETNRFDNISRTFPFRDARCNLWVQSRWLVDTEWIAEWQWLKSKHRILHNPLAFSATNDDYIKKDRKWSTGGTRRFEWRHTDDAAMTFFLLSSVVFLPRRMRKMCGDLSVAVLFFLSTLRCWC